MEAVYVAAKTNKSPLRPKESTETKMLFQCDVMLMIASPKEDNFRFSLLVTLQSKRSIIYLLERIGEMLRAIFVGLFNEIDDKTNDYPPEYRSDPIPTIRLQQISSKAANQ